MTKEYSNEKHGLQNPLEIVIKKFKQHPSINLINKNINNNGNVHFLPTKKENILKGIINLCRKKMKLLKTFFVTVSRMFQIPVALL